jgi:Uma2 family endonuclease
MTSLGVLAVKPLKKKPLLPYKYEERLRLPAYLRVKASFEDFIELSLECEYKVEYSNGDIVSIFETDLNNKNVLMGNASLTHEELVGNIIFALNLLFRGNTDFHVHGSNTQTFVGENIAIYNPDAVVVKGEKVTRLYKHNKKTQTCLTNPWLVVEVLSQGTREFDLVEKFNRYTNVDSLHQIVFIEQYWTEVMTYIRQPNNEWLYIKQTEKSARIPVANGFIDLDDIYQKMGY